MTDIPDRTKLEEPCEDATHVPAEPRYRYSREQLEQYFDRIALPCAKRVHNVSGLTDDEKLVYLNLLQKHQLCKIPWENLTQHYSFHRVIHIQPAYLFKKIVNRNGGGGYCMEANYFFHLILWNLGFDCYLAGSRIFHTDERRYGGWTHVVNIARIGSIKYLLDGGMGPNGPSRPLELVDGAVVDQVAPAQMMLAREQIPRFLDRDQKMWVFKYRHDRGKAMDPVYCFTDLEFLPEDIESMNFEPCSNRQTFFTHKVVAVRFTTDREVDSEEGPGSPSESALEGEIDGAISLNHNVLKWWRKGKKGAEVRCANEEDRLRVLKRYFGIEFNEEDREAILGTAAMLGGSGPVPGLPS